MTTKIFVSQIDTTNPDGSAAGIGSYIVIGASGPSWTNGMPTGYQGSVGWTGSVGYTGSLGQDGATGPVGFSGSVGYQGSGGIGQIGATGLVGYRGSAGVGYAGSVGDTGFRGSVGFIGSAGVGGTGFTGSVGFMGSAGLDAQTGYHGSAGDQGPVGYRGSAGDPGQNVGYKGSAGYSGSEGYTGSAGPDGNFGPTGFFGSAGYQGSGGEGYTGSVGFMGSVGFIGSVGYSGSSAAGYDGSVGFTGSVGFIGSSGYLGSGGYLGSAGYTGSAGNINVTDIFPAPMTAEAFVRVNSNANGVVYDANVYLTNTVTVDVNFNNNKLLAPQFKAYSETLKDLGTVGTPVTISLSDGNVQSLTLPGGSITVLDLSSAGTSAGRAHSVTLFITQGAGGGATIDWTNNTIAWPTAEGISAPAGPTLSTTGNVTDIITLYTLDAGSTWYGVLAGAGYV